MPCNRGRLTSAPAQLGEQRLQAICPEMQRMLERHPHRRKHLVNVVNDARSAFLSMQCGQCRIGFVGRPCRFQGEPSHTSREYSALCHAMTQCLKRAERVAELLAETEMFDGRRNRRLQQTADLGGERDAQPFAYVRRLSAGERRRGRVLFKSAHRICE